MKRNVNRADGDVTFYSATGLFGGEVLPFAPPAPPQALARTYNLLHVAALAQLLVPLEKGLDGPLTRRAGHGHSRRARRSVDVGAESSFLYFRPNCLFASSLKRLGCHCDGGGSL